MTCRDDLGLRRYRKELGLIEEVLLILVIRGETLDSYTDILEIIIQILSETELLERKLTLCDLLSKLPVSSDDEEILEKGKRIEEVCVQYQEISNKLKAFTSKFKEVMNTLNDENVYWKEFLLKEPVDCEVLKQMKILDRRELVNKIAFCLKLFNSGKETFENFLDEWDTMKPEMDQSVIGCLKELVVIVKEPTES